MAVVTLRNRTIAKETEARFDSTAYINKVNREQVGPVSYDPTRFHSIEHVHRNPLHYRGKFTRDKSERGPFPTRRDSTPGPFEAEVMKERYQEEKRKNLLLVNRFLNST